jgi:hypothetical protein
MLKTCFSLARWRCGGVLSRIDRLAKIEDTRDTAQQ